MSRIVTFSLLVGLLFSLYGSTPRVKAQLERDNTVSGKPVKVFILAGQSNMEGKGSVLTTERQLADEQKRSRFAHLVDEQGQWKERDDVWISYLGAHGRRHGALTMGYGKSQQDSVEVFGPELGFGWTVGDALDQPVLIIKTAWGGKSIDQDFRSPSRGLPDSFDTMYERATKRQPDLSREEFQKTYGHFYRQMVQEVKEVTSNLDQYVPGYQGQGYELAGFVWFQGWNDMFGITSIQDYEDNLSAMIQDLRSDLGAPQLPVVIGAMGHDGEKQKDKVKQIADSQWAVSQRPEFEGTVVTVRTAPYWDTEAEAAFEKYWADEKNRDVERWRDFGNDRGYHYFGSPVFFYRTGVGLGQAMLDLIQQD